MTHLSQYSLISPNSIFSSDALDRATAERVINKNKSATATIIVMLLLNAAFQLWQISPVIEWLKSEETPFDNTIVSARFTNNVQLNIDRGLNVINVWSGQHMAAWIYAGRETIDSKYITWKREPEVSVARTAQHRIKSDR